MAQFGAVDGSALRGKVVLIRFGDLHVPSMIRTLPYVRAWAENTKIRVWWLSACTRPSSIWKNVDSVRRAAKTNDS